MHTSKTNIHDIVLVLSAGIQFVDTLVYVITGKCASISLMKGSTLYFAIIVSFADLESVHNFR